MKNRSTHTNASEAATNSPLPTLVSRRRLLALAGGAALVSACSGASKKSAATTVDTVVDTTLAPTTTTTTTIAETTTTLAPVPPPPPVQPLTGLPLTDPALLSKVALVVKVSNDPGARPQTGLNDPDIVFEAWGAGPTRFATIWHSRDLDFVGPIRSCREQDVNLVGEFNRAVFACSGGNTGNLALLRASDLMLITEGKGPGWEQDPKRGRPHKTHANTALLRSNAGPDRSGPAQQFHYRAVGEAATSGDAMTGFDLHIQQVFVQWRYDTASGTYLRAQDGHPHTLTDKKQVSTDNVVILWLNYDPSHTDNRSPDGTTTGTGLTSVFTGGRVISGTWSRNSRLEPFALNDVSGSPILLTPGRTFIELPNSGQGSFRGNDKFTPIV
jgi:hypothetical protein